MAGLELIWSYTEGSLARLAGTIRDHYSGLQEVGMWALDNLCCCSFFSSLSGGGQSYSNFLASTVGAWGLKAGIEPVFKAYCQCKSHGRTPYKEIKKGIV